MLTYFLKNLRTATDIGSIVTVYDTIGNDLLPENLRNACKNSCAEQSPTSSRWIAQVTAQVNRQM